MFSAERIARAEEELLKSEVRLQKWKPLTTGVTEGFEIG
jgi:hypothetical protein